MKQSLKVYLHNKTPYAYITEDIATVTFRNMKTNKVVIARKNVSFAVDIQDLISKKLAPSDIMTYPSVDDFDYRFSR